MIAATMKVPAGMRMTATQMTTSKGHTFVTDLTDEGAALVVAADPRRSDFGRSLADAFTRGRLTANQRPWLHKLALEALERLQGAQAPAQPAAEAEPFALPIAEMMRVAAGNLRNPRVTVDLSDDDDGIEARFSLYLAGARSRHAGDIMVTDGGRYGESTYYGRIDIGTGAFYAARQAPAWITDALRAMAADPAAFTARSGRRTGNCCFCRRELSTAESLHVGYGPICADHYGLPWGHVA